MDVQLTKLSVLYDTVDSIGEGVYKCSRGSDVYLYDSRKNKVHGPFDNIEEHANGWLLWDGRLCFGGI